ncbi:MAG TPA: chromosomal replication initiator protein DnaA [Atribacteraceae bacterium]|nr:chromosomal replication initiator protein DnaA [Atribacteraceae bacterium]
MNKTLGDFQDLWDKSLEIIRERITIPEFNSWIESTQPLSMSDNLLTVSVPTELAREKLLTKYLETIRYSIQKASEGAFPHIDISVVVMPHNETRTRQGPQFRNHDSEKIPLNLKYSFSTFVVGNSNKFAHAASFAVAESPARSYNPLFIYGGVGLGKTHLMHAIGIHVAGKNPTAKIEYSTSEKFTNELINSIRDDKTEAFRQKYRSVDVLLIDDIQFLAGKERTQEEFFHTFNSLHDAFKQIVLTSDRPPKEIPTLEDRLRSRFEWGLLADIQPPDLETRIAILRKKAELENVTVPDDVITFIASQISSNIRELEGALVRIKAFCILNQIPLEVEVAREVLKDILPKKKTRKIDVLTIQRVVADHYHLKAGVMRARKRTREIAFPRQVAMFLTRTLTNLSLPTIGEEFGGRDHTTVLHAYEKIKSDMGKNPQLVQEIEVLIKRVRSSDAD